MANRVKGGGFESASVYTNSEFTFCEIDNIHGVSKIFENMYKIAAQPSVFKDES